jgi:hypothetical protein
MSPAAVGITAKMVQASCEIPHGIARPRALSGQIMTERSAGKCEIGIPVAEPRAAARVSVS